MFASLVACGTLGRYSIFSSVCQHVWHRIVDGVCVFELIGCGRLMQVQLLTVEFAVDLVYVVC